jgi:flavin reductase (DIM6/NTAB) family NADH-FMN oxidoreductase RutF
MARLACEAEEAARTIESRGLRDALALVPTGVVIVTALTVDGVRLGMTMNSFASVSLTPPLVLFCIDRRARSLQAWLKVPGYAVNVLARAQDRLSTQFAHPSAAKWHGVAATVGRHGAPLLDGSLARFECAAHAQCNGGDHVIFLARVESVTMDRTAPPLVFHRGRYTALAELADMNGAAGPGWPLAMHY